jgi:hypothetical protein
MSWLSNDLSLAVESARHHPMAEDVTGNQGRQVNGIPGRWIAGMMHFPHKAERCPTDEL